MIDFGIVKCKYNQDSDDDNENNNNDDNNDDIENNFENDEATYCRDVKYVVTEYIRDVVPVRAIFDTLSPLEEALLVDWCGTTMATLHAVGGDQNESNVFVERINALKSDAVTRLIDRCSLPNQLLQQVQPFLAKHLDFETMCRDDWTVLHGDVTDENILLKDHQLYNDSNNDEMNNNDKNGDGNDELNDEEIEQELEDLLGCVSDDETLWSASSRLLKPHALIDFGDSFQCGDVYYEWVALHISVFRCSKQQMATFYTVYDRVRGVDLGNFQFF